MTYKLKCDEQHWVETTWDEEMKESRRDITDIVDDTVSYYWITSDDRDEVLKVMDFINGEDIITQLSDGRLESFEDAEEQFQHAEIQDERPPLALNEP